ncbi:pyridoxamine 5'-phosphate oxidase family protein [Microbacterium sp. BWT-B31]|uniref:pyridoxamine 5'-phosphate oxidase family protein n=1 Tax=Microbacterium sp. BWT-B31 TaxID=3232072 RepID=UPI0035283C16
MSAPLVLDPAVPLHALALERLESEEVGWLGTAGRDGFPHAVPVWFLWIDGTVVVFVQPRSVKARNLAADPRAVFHLQTEWDGENVQVLQGTAEFSPEPTAVWLERHRAAYLEKYQAGLDRLQWTIDRVIDQYTLAVVLRPHKLISWAPDRPLAASRSEGAR